MTKKGILAKLTREVESQLKFLKGVVWFAEEITQKKGKILEKEVSGSSTYIDAILENFEGFTFHTQGGFSMQGGYTVEIQYLKETALDIDYDAPVHINQKLDDCQVKKISDDQEWRNAIKSLIKKEHKILSRQRAKKKPQNTKQSEDQILDLAISAMKGRARAVGIR